MVPTVLLSCVSSPRCQLTESRFCLSRSNQPPAVDHCPQPEHVPREVPQMTCKQIPGDGRICRLGLMLFTQISLCRIFLSWCFAYLPVLHRSGAVHGISAARRGHCSLSLMPALLQSCKVFPASAGQAIYRSRNH